MIINYALDQRSQIVQIQFYEFGYQEVGLNADTVRLANE